MPRRRQQARQPRPGFVPLLSQRVGFDYLQKLSVSLLLSLVLFAYKRSLVPLYASVPTQYTLEKTVLFTTIGVAFSPIWFSTNNILCGGVLLAAAPSTAYWLAAITARMRDPLWGPMITHALVLVPIVYFFTTIAIRGNLQVATHRQPERPTKICRLPSRYAIIEIITLLLTTKLLMLFWPVTSFMTAVTDSDIFLYLAGTTLTLWTTIYAWYPSIQTETRHPVSQFKFLLPPIFLTAWVLIHPFMRSPVLRLPLRQPFIHPTHPLRILSSIQSTTGLIVVGETLPINPSSQEHADYPKTLRYLRASHSILGGVWIGDQVKTIDNALPILDEQGTPLGDSIYSAFVLQEAARLVNIKEGGQQNALFIGLGVGISATAFNRHNISTTIVEIDPAVFDAAQRFFGLEISGPGSVFLEDARGWVARRRSAIESLDVVNGKDLYDMVVHDCFSGGGVPQHMFTMEFWDDLKSVIHEDGVVAVNFVGEPNSDASLAIFLTLKKSFGQCRAFHDSPEATPEQSDFVNMVIFCTCSSQPLTFRPSRDADYLNSYLRRHILSTLPKREVYIGAQKASGERDIDKFILTDNHNPLNKWLEKLAFSHWKLMREVFPDVVWETY